MSLVSIPQLASHLRGHYNLKDDVDDLDIVNTYIKAYPDRKEQIDWNSYIPKSTTPFQTYAAGLSQQAAGNLFPNSPVLNQAAIVQQPTPIMPMQPTPQKPAVQQPMDISAIIQSYAPNSTPAASTYVATPQLPTGAELQKQAVRAANEEAIASEKQIYEDYRKQFAHMLRDARKQGTVEPFSNKLPDGRRLASAKEYALYRAGKKDITMRPDLYFPERKELESVGTLRNIGAAAGELTYNLTEPLRKNTGLAKGTDEFLQTSQIVENAETEKRKEELKARLEQGETLNDEDAQWLADNDKGFIAEFWEGVKSIPELLETIYEDPEERRKFFNDMVAQLPASMAVGGAIKFIPTAVKVANNARRARAATSAANSGRISKEAADRWRKSEEANRLREQFKKRMTENPTAFGSLAIDFGVDQVADAAIEGLIEMGMGGDFNFARNLGEGFGLDGLLQTGIGAGKKFLQKADAGSNYVTPEQFDVAVGHTTKGQSDVGFEGNLHFDHGVESGDRTIARGIQELANHPDRAELIRGAAQRRGAGASTPIKIYETPNVTYKTREELDAAQYFSEEEGFKEAKGSYDPKSRMISIYGTGHGGTIIHESAHDFLRQVYSKDATPEMNALGNEIADWNASVQQWAEANGMSDKIPKGEELFTQAFTHRLGFKEPGSEAVKNIPIPDDLLNKVGDAFKIDPAQRKLQGDTFAEYDAADYSYRAQNYRHQFDPDYNGENLPFSMTDGTQFSLTPAQKQSIEEAKANIPKGREEFYQRGVKDREKVRIKLLREVERNGGKIETASRDGVEGYINKDSVNKIVKITEGSHKNKFTPEQHWAVASDIIPLYQNSTEVLEHPDHKEKSEIEAIRRFVAPLSENSYAIITGKVIENQGQKVHSMELVKAEKLEGRLESMLAGTTQKATPVSAANPPSNSKDRKNQPTTASPISFSLASAAGIPEARKNDPKVKDKAAQMWREKGTDSPFFKRWFGDSKTINDEGEPKIYYHGSGENFNKFDITKARSYDPERLDYDLPGFYFSESKQEASDYGKARAFYVSIKKPYEGDIGKLKQKLGSWRNVYDNLLEKGYDGILDYDGETIAFSPTQIKSATDNAGTFDGSNPDIRYSLSPVEKNKAEGEIYQAAYNFHKRLPGMKVGSLESMDQFRREQAKAYRDSSGTAGRKYPDLDEMARNFADDHSNHGAGAMILDSSGEPDGDAMMDIALGYQLNRKMGRKADSDAIYGDSRKISLEERIDRILYTGEIPLDGNAYKGNEGFELGKWKSIRAFIDRLRLNANGKNAVYENLDTGDKIIISRESAGKITQHWKDGEIYQKTLAHIPEIIRNMKLLDEAKNNGINYSYFVTPIELDGNPHTVFSTVRRENNSVYYDHNVFEGAVGDVFAKAKTETSDPKYSRLHDILKDIDDVLQKTESDRNPDLVRARSVTAASTNEYTKKSGDAVEKSEDVEKKLQETAKTEENTTETKLGELLETLKALDKDWIIDDKIPRAQLIRRKMQDKFHLMKLIHDLLPNKSDDANFYRDENLRYGKIEYQITQVIQKRFLDPINEIIAKENLKIEDIDDYIYALAAPAINKYIYDTYGKKDGSGVSHEWVKETMKRLKPQLPQLAKIRKINREMNAFRRQMAVEAGILSKEESELWAKMYPNFVPMKGLTDSEGKGNTKEAMLLEKLQGFNSSNFTGKGVQPSRGIMKRFGRTTKAPNVFEQNIAETIANVTRCENNKAMQSLYREVKNNPIEGFWEINPDIRTRKGEFLKYGERGYEDIAREKHSFVKVYFDGKAHFIEFKTEAGQRQASNIKGMNKKQLNWLMRKSAAFGRKVKAMFTSLNPVFIPFNGLKDFEGGITKSLADDGAKIAGETAAFTPVAVASTMIMDGKKGINRLPILKKINVTESDIKKVAEWRDRWQAAGGKIGYTTMYTWRDMTDQLMHTVKDSNRGDWNPAKLWNVGVDFVETVNGNIENGIRLAYFKSLVESGMNDADAALKAKDLTANFNRKGEWEWLDTPFLFWNASVQGSYAIISPLFSKNPKVRKRAWAIAGGFVLAGGLIDFLNYTFAGEDEDGRNRYDKIPEYEKRTNIIIMMPGGQAFKIPLAYGLNAIYNTGRLSARMARAVVTKDETYSGTDYALDMFENIMSAFNFFGSDVDPRDLRSISFSLSSITQFAFWTQPLADIAANKDFTGRPIVPENQWQKNLPEAHKYYPGVNPYIKDFAIWLNDFTGGGNKGAEYNTAFESEFHSGLMDWSPEQMEHLFNFFTGGIGRMAQQTIGMIETKRRGEDIQPRQMPYISRLWYRPSPSQDMGSLYEMKDFTAALKAQQKAMEERVKKAHAMKDDKAKADLLASYEYFTKNTQYLLIWDTQTQKVLNHWKEVGKIEDYTDAKIGKGAKNERNEAASRMYKAGKKIDKLTKERNATNDEKKRIEIEEEMKTELRNMIEAPEDKPNSKAIESVRRPSYKAGSSAYREQKMLAGAAKAKYNALKAQGAAAKGEERKNLAEEARKFHDDNYGYIIFDEYFQKLPKSAQTSNEIAKAYEQIEKLQEEYKKSDNPERRAKLKEAMVNIARQMTEGYLEADQP